MTRKRCYKPGDLVVTQSTSGRALFCTVREKADHTFEPDTYLLDSPAHGYEIARHVSEMRVDQVGIASGD